jgi:hypothetical protein
VEGDSRNKKAENIWMAPQKFIACLHGLRVLNQVSLYFLCVPCDSFNTLHVLIEAISAFAVTQTVAFSTGKTILSNITVLPSLRQSLHFHILVLLQPERSRVTSYFTRKCMVPLESVQLQMTFFPAVIAREVVNIGDKNP